MIVPVAAAITFEGIGLAPHPYLTSVGRYDEPIPDLRKDQLSAGTPDLRCVHVHREMDRSIRGTSRCREMIKNEDRKDT
jgi:hypothetical protein